MKFKLEILLTKTCKNPKDISYELSEIAETLSVMKKWPLEDQHIFGDHSSMTPNGFWEVS